MPQESVVEEVDAKFRRKGLHVSQAWISERLIAREQFSDDVLEELYTALLMSDLRLSALARLPPNAMMLKRYMLEVSIVVQILAATNIGTSLEYRDTDSGKRLLKLRVSDGATDVVAVEGEQVPGLPLHPPQGCKMLIRKGAEMRRGVLLLTPQVCQVLGGAFSVGNQMTGDEKTNGINSDGNDDNRDEKRNGVNNDSNNDNRLLAAGAVDYAALKSRERTVDEVAVSDTCSITAVSKASSVTDDVTISAKLVIIDDEVDVRGHVNERAGAHAIAVEDGQALTSDDIGICHDLTDDICSPPDLDALLAEQQHISRSGNTRGMIVGVERLDVVDGLFVAEVWLEEPQQQSQCLIRLSNEICAELLHMSADSYSAEIRASTNQQRVDLQMSCCSQLCGVEGYFSSDYRGEGKGNSRTPIVIVSFAPLV